MMLQAIEICLVALSLMVLQISRSEVQGQDDIVIHTVPPTGTVLGQRFDINCSLRAYSGTSVIRITWTTPTNMTTTSTTMDFLVLTIDPVTSGDAGIYTCSTSYENNTLTATYELTPIPITAMITEELGRNDFDFEVGENTTLHCAIYGTHTLENPSQDYTWMKDDVRLAEEVRSSLTLAPLVAGDGDSYTCMVIVNDISLSSFVSVIASQTIRVFAPPVLNTPTSVTATTISLSWTQPGSAVDHYVVYYTYTVSQCGSGSGVAITNGEARSFTLLAIEEDSDYTITLTANSAVGSLVSNGVSATTTTAAPSGSPSSVTFGATNLTSITVQWGEIPCRERNGEITGYTVQYSSALHSNAVTVSEPNTRTLVVGGLLPSTTYTFSVRAQGAPTSSSASGTTSTAQPADGCLAEMTTLPPLEEGGLEVILMWPESDLGETVVLPCPCDNLAALGAGTINRTATRTCGGSLSEGASWEPEMVTACNFSSATRTLCQMTNSTGRKDVVLEVLDTVTSNEDIGVDELGVTTILLEAISNNTEQDANLTESLLEVVDNLIVADRKILQKSQKEANTSARILTLVEDVAQSIPIPENETSVVFQLDYFAVAITDLNPDNFQGQHFSIDEGGTIEFFNDTSILSDMRQTSASLSIPGNILMTSSGGTNMSASTPRITTVAYTNDALFTRRGETKHSVVGGIIVSASLSVSNSDGETSNVKVVNLDPPIKLTFQKRPSLENGTNTSCNFWDFSADEGFGDWSSMGCKVVEDNDTLVVCECTHLTNFAILLDPNPVEVQVSPELEQTFTAISFVGVAVSIVCLILTVITYISSKKLRKSEAGQLLLHLCFGLLGIYVFFIVCFLVVKEEVVCAVAGGLLHYFLLVTFFLMAAEAINLYTKLVIVLGVPDCIKNRYVLKVSLLSWIVPLFIVGASEAPNWRNYLGDEFCRPYGAPFWGGLVAPFGLIYILNWVLFVSIFISLVRKSASDQKQRFIIALMLSLLFGLGWGVGMVATTSIPVVAVSLTLQAVFILLTSFQGLLMFLMNCVRLADARNEWKRWINIATCRRVAFEEHKRQTSGELSCHLRSATSTCSHGDHKAILTKESSSFFRSSLEMMDLSLNEDKNKCATLA